MSGTYAETDGAANLENGSIEGRMGGTNVKGESKANQAEAARRVLQAKPRKSKHAADAHFEQLIRNMGPDTLHTPYLQTQLDDLRNNDQPDGYHSSTLLWTVIAGAQTLPYATDAALDLLAANSPDRPNSGPVPPRLDIDDAA